MKMNAVLFLICLMTVSSKAMATSDDPFERKNETFAEQSGLYDSGIKMDSKPLEVKVADLPDIKKLCGGGIERVVLRESDLKRVNKKTGGSKDQRCGFVPVMGEGGQIDGFTQPCIRAGSLEDLIGLKKGDVLLAVDGVKWSELLGGPSTFFKALRRSKAACLVVKRTTGLKSLKLVPGDTPQGTSSTTPAR